MMVWICKHPRARPEMLGYIPGWLDDVDPRPAREQLDTGYRHGGGWQPSTIGLKLEPRGLCFPGDPPMLMLFEAKLRDETIRLYEHDWVAIVQADGSYEVCRMD